MANVIALYGRPSDTEHFDRYYHSTHVPLAKTLPGLLGYEINATPVVGLDGTSTSYYLVATLSFPSLETIHTALVSEVGKAVAADLANFATGGVTLLMFETKEV